MSHSQFRSLCEAYCRHFYKQNELAKDSRIVRAAAQHYAHSQRNPGDITDSQWLLCLAVATADLCYAGRYAGWIPDVQRRADEAKAALFPTTN